MNRAHLMLIAAALAIASAFTGGIYVGRLSSHAACDPTRDVVYVRQYQASGEPVQRVTFFKFDVGADKDVGLVTIEGYYASQYQLDRKGRVFLIPSSDPGPSLYVYSICVGKLEKALDLPEADRAVTSARYLGDGDTLLVATRDGGPAGPATNSRLELYERGRRISVADVSKASPPCAEVEIIRRMVA